MQVVQQGGPIGGAPILSTIVRQGAVKMRNAKGAPVKQATFSEADLTWSACSNGTENGTGAVTQTDFEAGVRTFYDAECAELAEDAYVHETNNTPGSSTTLSVSIAGTVLKKTLSGTVVSYDTVTGTGNGVFPNLQVTLQFTHAPNQTAAPTAQYAMACGIAGEGGSSPQSCGLGSVAHVASASADLGTTMSLTMTNGTSTTINGTVKTYAGALNSMTLAPGTFPAFTISGGQQLSTATLTGTEAATSTFTLTDSKTDATVNMTLSQTGAVNGTIVRTSTGASVATFVTDRYGNGTITYSNGTTATITDW
ncbi:MAG TPA: hypothetical protein VFL13_15115, partial [Candidatus Baltobacteraceae bacterium]|nr:hypothetical protein [Candidatus Baltobacteraceae bacterium]